MGTQGLSGIWKRPGVPVAAQVRGPRRPDTGLSGPVSPPGMAPRRKIRGKHPSHSCGLACAAVLGKHAEPAWVLPIPEVLTVAASAHLLVPEFSHWALKGGQA